MSMLLHGVLIFVARAGASEYVSTKFQGVPEAQKVLHARGSRVSPKSPRA